MFKRKKSEEFIELLKRAYDYIKLKKFSEAVALYHKIDEKYKLFPEIDKTEKIKQDIKRLHKELTLYLRVNEAYIFSQEGNLDRLKQELDTINSSLYDLDPSEDAKELREYAENHYKFFLDIYTYKTSQSQFDTKYTQLIKLIEENNIEEAKKSFSQLLIIYNQLINYLSEEEKEKLYSNLKEAFKEISIKSMVNKIKTKPTEIKPLKVKLKKYKGFEHPKLKGFSYEFSNEYNELHELLKKGEITKAEDKYSNL